MSCFRYSAVVTATGAAATSIIELSSPFSTDATFAPSPPPSFFFFSPTPPYVSLPRSSTATEGTFVSRNAASAAMSPASSTLPSWSRQ